MNDSIVIFCLKNDTNPTEKNEFCHNFYGDSTSSWMEKYRYHELGRNKATVTITRILETIYMILSRSGEFIVSTKALTERKMNAMFERSKNPARTAKLNVAIKSFMSIVPGNLSGYR
ncbi:MAG: hypothetical protein B2I17_02185 [Thermoplasmatales archaeon B_DKE]|nr:MAG: hypothetical protein B2I17_02185 [Thermoplasmatales archaeon B_DKE]